MSCTVETHSGHIRLHVPDVANVTSTVASPSTVVGGVRWWLTVDHKGIFLGLHLHSKSESIAHFRAYTVYRLSLISTDGAVPTSIGASRIFYDGASIGSDKFQIWDDAVSPEEGYIADDNSLLFDADFTFELHVLPDFSEQSPPFHTPIHVHDRTFFVDRDILALHSDRFRQLLNAESFNQEEGITISDIPPHIFLTVLFFLHCDIMTVTSDTVEELLALTDFPVIRARCETFLAYPGKLSLAQRLLLAEKHALPLARSRCRAEISHAKNVLKPDTSSVDYARFDSATVAKAAKTAVDSAKAAQRDPVNPAGVIRKQNAATCALM